MSLGSVDALVAPDGRREECENVDVVLQHTGRGGHHRSTFHYICADIEQGSWHNEGLSENLQAKELDL